MAAFVGVPGGNTKTVLGRCWIDNFAMEVRANVFLLFGNLHIYEQS